MTRSALHGHRTILTDVYKITLLKESKTDAKFEKTEHMWKSYLPNQGWVLANTHTLKVKRLKELRLETLLTGSSKQTAGKLLKSFFP